MIMGYNVNQGDYLLPGEDIEQRELFTVLDPIFDDFLSPGSASHLLAEQALEVRSTNPDVNPDVYLVPAVKMLLDATLAVTEIPAVNQRLSKEVQDRSCAAGEITYKVTHLAAEVDIINDFYRPYYDQVSLVDATNVASSSRVGSLAATPFGDVRMAAGGALRFLAETNPQVEDSELKAVIKRSKGLLAIAGINADHLDEADHYLGLPYIHSRRLRSKGIGNDFRVGFNQRTQDMLQRFQVKGRGCPAQHIQNLDMSGALLADYWERLVDYLIVPGATAKAVRYKSLRIPGYIGQSDTIHRRMTD